MLSTGRVQTLDLYSVAGQSSSSSESVTAGLDDCWLAASFGAAGDRAMIAREFILTGSTLGPIGTQTLFDRISPTSTLKVTNGSSGWGSIQAQNVTANGSVTSSYLEFTSASRLLPSAQLTHSRKSIRLSREWHELSCGRDRRHQLDV